MKLTNGLRVPVGAALGGGTHDDKEKTLKFEADESGQSYTAEGSDGRTYSFGLSDVLVTVLVSDKPDLVAQRKAGIPIPKADAKKIDEQIKKEQEDKEALQKEAAPTPTATTGAGAKTNVFGKPKS